MGDKQLNVWIDSDLKEALAARAKREKTSVTDLTERILGQDMARQSGAVIEQQSLPIIREIIRAEVSEGITQILNGLYHAMHIDLMDEIKMVARQSDDRVAKLIVRAIREAGISRRLALAYLSKTYGPEFARSAYESAREDVGKELATKETVKTIVSRDEG